MLDFIISLDLWVKVYSGVLLVAFIGCLLAAWRASRQVRTAAKKLQEFLVRYGGHAQDRERLDGRALEAINKLQSKTGELRGAAAAWWERLDHALSAYGSDSRSRGWFLTSSAGELLDEDTVIHEHYDGSFFGGVPGLLTALGLLGTFIAILIGLGGLRPDGDMIRGVPKLVGSLSGKFTTSVIALGLSAMFTLIEGLVFQAGMRRSREQLIGTVHRVLPRISTSRVLVDLQTESLKQTRSLANISSDLVDKVAGLFATEFRENVAPSFAAGISNGMATRLSEDLVPALGRVSDTMTQVSAAVQRLESAKQESVVGELRGLTKSLEEALANSLAEMGAQFRDALRGSTHDEFSGLAKILQDSANVVAQMNGSFATMQGALSTLIEESRSTTSAQMANSAERAEQLNRLVEGLLIRLNDSATQNASHVSHVLTQVVSELTERVTALSGDLTAQVTAATAQTQAAAAESLRVAGDWSARSDQRLTELVATLEGKVADFDKASASLAAAHRMIEGTLAQSNDGLRSMREAASEVRAFSASLGGLQGKVLEAQQAHAQVAAHTREAVGELSALSQRHDALLMRYDATFSQASAVFEGLDERLRRVLETILDKIQQYNVGVEKNFHSIVGHVNNTLPQMGEVLAGAAVELRDQVDELTAVIEKANRRLQ